MKTRYCERCRFILPPIRGSRWCPVCDPAWKASPWLGIAVGLAVAGMATWLFWLWV